MDMQQASANSSDFVRKLYKMLEVPSYDSVVRWGNEGDSFVVLENEKFTKSILPKHFKHSNFASFVRQLNKYDFHKVRHNNEETGQSPYGAGAWEFKHPDFKANNKDALDNIRRKAPIPRKSNQAPDDLVPVQQMDLVNTQLVATQQQLEQLQHRYSELSVHQSMLLQEVISLQKTVVNHEHVIQSVMSFLHGLDAQRRRESRVALSNPFGQHGLTTTQNGTDQKDGTHALPPIEEEPPASPLMHASKLLNEVNADIILNTRSLEQINEMSVRLNGSLTTPPASEAAFRAARPSSRGAPTSANSTLRYGDLDGVVYPVGQNNGIDPMYSEHIHNIPYPMPAKALEPHDPRFQPAEARKKTNLGPSWIRQPQILLVEDDQTCRRIGGKFLYAFNCSIDSALDGLEAVNKVNAGSKYDLILMDIIMPNLDGVSACHLIRQFDNTPIIAMTSNIRSDDISMYFQHGMNDVLPKPFTKEGLLSMLEKHLSHLKHPIPGMEHTITGNMSSRHSQSLKDEESPSNSPATMSTNWHSPGGQLTGASPVANVHSGDYMGTVRGSSNDAFGMPSALDYSTSPQQSMGMRGAGAPRRGIADITGGEDLATNVKRQQMFAQPLAPKQQRK